MTARKDRNLARAVFARLKSGPRTISQLADETAYSETLLRSRLQSWCEEGRCVGRIVGGDAKSGFVVSYRLNENFGIAESRSANDAMREAA